MELPKRWEIAQDHIWHSGIDETMSIDHTKHSLFGASKVAADVLVQEYGRYFDLKTGVFRGGCLTGPAHSGTKLHGFLSYLMRCCITGKKYFIYGYKGKQVRDNIHSFDLVNSLWHYFEKPRVGEVYNMGGGRYSNCSMMEAIDLCQEIAGREMNYAVPGDQPHRRPHLVDLRPQEVRAALPGLEDHLRRAPHPARDPRRAEGRGPRGRSLRQVLGGLSLPPLSRPVPHSGTGLFLYQNRPRRPSTSIPFSGIVPLRVTTL